MLSCYKIVELKAATVEAYLPDLSSILIDAVEGGASVSFMMPFTRVEAFAYWQSILPVVKNERTVLLAAILDERVVGTVFA